MPPSNVIMGPIVAGMMFGFCGARGFAADPANPDWPCIQHKVPTLTSAQMWDGHAVEDLTQWHDNEELKKLISILASRRVPLEEAAAAIARFSDGQPQDGRNGALALLFAGLLSTVNSDRAVVMSGIERFQMRQKARAVEIEREGAVLRQLQDRAESDEKARSELEAEREKYDWDVRVFTERQQSLPIACEVPVLIEQRLFELGREIRSRMND